ncbi:hypothetical protein GGR56DRAFT_645635 [Xylariaceae sp. FL0804]|nr:hypothetical protein GGR56DRAFT_645635 [Xylariaceae sp. FL0804]
MSDASERDDHVSDDSEVIIDEDGGSVESGSEDLGPEESDCEDSDTMDGNGLFDMEAVESDGQSEEDDSDDGAELYSFPQFTRLPNELREIVWKFFNPDLEAQRRVLVFHFTAMSYSVDLWESAVLSDSTAATRAMLAVDSNTRALVLRSYPDVFRFRREKCAVPFNKSRDMVIIDGCRSRLEGNDAHRLATNQGAELVAIDTDAWFGPETPIMIAHLVDNLSFRVCVDSDCFLADELRRFVRGPAWNVLVQSRENVPDPEYISDIELMYCWFDQTSLEKELARDARDSNELHAVAPPTGFAYIKPPASFVIKFALERGLKRYRRIKGNEPMTDDEWDSGSEDGSAPDEVDEYELDGFVVDSSSEQSEDTDAVDDEEVSVSGEGHPVDDLSQFDGFSPLQGDYAEPSEDPDAQAARFSSLEPDHTDGSDPGHPQQKANRQKRRIVSSDDEDGPGSEDDDLSNRPRPAKRARVVLSDSEDEEDPSGGGARNDNRDDSAEDEDDDRSDETDKEDEADESDESSAPAKPMSLLQRLREFRSDNPVSPAGSNEGSDDSADDGGAHLQHDMDEDDEDDEGEADGGLIEDMAESEDEESEEDGW